MAGSFAQRIVSEICSKDLSPGDREQVADLFSAKGGLWEDVVRGKPEAIAALKETVTELLKNRKERRARAVALRHLNRRVP